MNLFSIIPDRFFSVLASPLKEHYAGILFKIYDQYLLTSLGMERDLVVDVIVDYIEVNWDEGGHFSGVLDDEIWEESLDNPPGPRDRVPLFCANWRRAAGCPPRLTAITSNTLI